MAKDGFPYRDSFCGEISPKNSLIHLHGFMIFEKPYTGNLIHERLSYHWSHIHGSPIVWVKNMWDANGAIAYDVKHAVKNFVSAERFLFGDKPPHILRSKDWLPPGCRAVEKEIARAMCEARDWEASDDDEITDEYYNRRYIPFKWEFAKYLLRQWKAGEDIMLDRDSCKVMIQGERIFRLEFEPDDEVVLPGELKLLDEVASTDVEVGFPDEDEEIVNLIDEDDFVEMDVEGDNCG